MKTPAEQPDITGEPTVDMAKLRTKVLELTAAAQAKKAKIYKERADKEAAEEAAEKKEREEKRRRDLLANGKHFAEWILASATRQAQYTIRILGFDGYNCEGIEEYIVFLRRARYGKEDKIRELKLGVDKRMERMPYWNGSPSHPSARRAMGLESEIRSLEEEINRLYTHIEALHGHIEGFAGAIFGSDTSNINALLGAMRAAMIVGADIFHGLDGKGMISRLQIAVVEKAEKKLSAGKDLDESEITEIERILKTVQEAIGQQIK